MSNAQPYSPGPATGAHVHKEGDKWTLVLVRELRHKPEKVWRALTDPAELAAWAPFDPDRNLSTTGPATLTVAGMPQPQVSETIVKRADPPRLLEFTWGGGDLRWELETHGSGTRLTLWHNINRQYISWGAAGWHICLDVMDRVLSGEPIGRIVGPVAMQFEGWQRLSAEYTRQFSEPAQ